MTILSAGFDVDKLLRGIGIISIQIYIYRLTAVDIHRGGTIK